MNALIAMNLLAQAGVAGAVGQWVIWGIIILAIIAVLYIVTRWMGVEVPPAIIQVFWVLVAAAIGIIAIRFLLTL